MQDLAYYADAVENLTRTVGCWTTAGWTAPTILPCLRGLDVAKLFAAEPAQIWNPLIDGDFLTGYPSSLMRDGKYNAIPLLVSFSGLSSPRKPTYLLFMHSSDLSFHQRTGTNTDEGGSFSPAFPVVPIPNTEQDLFNEFLYWRSYGLSPPTIRKLFELYPNNPCIEPPLYIWNCSVFPIKGLVWRRGAAIGGDMGTCSIPPHRPHHAR